MAAAPSDLDSGPWRGSSCAVRPMSGPRAGRSGAPCADLVVKGAGSGEGSREGWQSLLLYYLLPHTKALEGAAGGKRARNSGGENPQPAFMDPCPLGRSIDKQAPPWVGGSNLVRVLASPEQLLGATRSCFSPLPIHPPHCRQRDLV